MFAVEVAELHGPTTPWSLTQATSQGPTLDIFKGLGAALRWNNAGVMTTQRSSWVSTVLSTIMPEEHHGQHLKTAEKLCGLQRGDAFTEILMLQLYLLSNNFGVYENDHGILTPARLKIHDMSVVELFRRSNLASFEQLKHLVSAHDATLAAIMEQLFASALRLGDVELLRRMLESGFYHGKCVASHLGLLGRANSPLEVAASINDPRLSLKTTQLLLSFKVCVESKSGAAVTFAIERKHKDVAKALIAAGIPIPSASLRIALQIGDDELLRTMLDAGADVRARIAGNDGYTTAVGYVVGQTNGIQSLRTLIEKLPSICPATPLSVHLS